MNKQEFLDTLELRLSKLSHSEIQERLDFYSEMIDDLVEEGRGEEEAIAQIGSVEVIAAQILADYSPLESGEKKAKRQRKLEPWMIVFLILGSPIWLSLAAAALSVIISLYATLLSIVISFWSVFAAFVCCAPCAVAAGVVFIVKGTVLPGFVIIGAGLVCAGLAILLFFGCREATGGLFKLARLIFVGIKRMFVKEEGAQ